MNNNITILDLLNMADEDCSVTTMEVKGNTKFITIEKNRKQMICPICSSRLYSKGKLIRHPNNPIFQDGYTLDITLIGRRWICSNPDCDYKYTDEYSFIEPRKKNTKLVPLMIVRDMKDLHLSCRQVASRYNVSDTYVHEVFMQYVSMPRLPLTEIISIDEVYLNISPQFKYAVVIMDFNTGEILDIVPSRRKEVMHNYFMSIPKEEREKVKYLVSDMYNPYINYTNKYFPNSLSIVDSFHILQWLLTFINRYINSIKKKYLERDRKQLEERNYKNNKDFETQKDSREVYILKHAKWVLLMNRKNMHTYPRQYNRFLDQYLDSFDWENMFLSLDDHFKEILELKELYEEFNGSFINDYDGATARLTELIQIYKESNIAIFKQFANLLENYFPYIVNSFKYIKPAKVIEHETTLRRLSNGPMESFNNIPSAFRTRSHGLKNFEFVRNRILWSRRPDAAILAVPKAKKDIQNKTGVKRGPYNKNN